jgi:hypothetical protein
MEFESEATRACSSCYAEKPISHYRRRCAGSEHRHCQCRACHNEQERERQKAKRCGKTVSFARSCLDIDNPKDAARLLSALTIQRFGGMARFARLFVEAIDDARRRGRSATVLRCVMWFINLSVAAEPTLDDLSDEQLVKLVRVHVQEMVRENPELAVEAAQRLGWIVIPPSDCE